MISQGVDTPRSPRCGAAMAEIAEQTHVETDVSAQRVAAVYAEALLDTAEKQNLAAEIGDELNALVTDIFQKHPEIERSLAGAAIGRHTKSALLQAAFSGRASDLLARF